MTYQLNPRFWAKVEQTPTCWVWKGAQTKGYGQFNASGRHGYSHRFSWEWHFGEIPKGMLVCHKCDNPLCVNPNHLFLGTQKDNIHDCISKGRARRGVSRGVRNGSSKLTDALALKARRLYSHGYTVREIAPMIGVSKST